MHLRLLKTWLQINYFVVSQDGQREAILNQHFQIFLKTMVLFFAAPHFVQSPAPLMHILCTYANPAVLHFQLALTEAYFQLRNIGNALLPSAE